MTPQYKAPGKWFYLGMKVIADAEVVEGYVLKFESLYGWRVIGPDREEHPPWQGYLIVAMIFGIAMLNVDGFEAQAHRLHSLSPPSSRVQSSFALPCTCAVDYFGIPCLFLDWVVSHRHHQSVRRHLARLRGLVTDSPSLLFVQPCQTPSQTATQNRTDSRRCGASPHSTLSRSYPPSFPHRVSASKSQSRSSAAAKRRMATRYP